MDERANGTWGRALVVDAGSGEHEVVPLADDELRAVVGGVGLGAHLVRLLAHPTVDPLAPAAPLVFAFSPLVGTPLTTSAKFAVVAKSPLTGRLNDALASSHFAIAGKRTGNDAIVVVGAAAEPSVVVVDGDDVRVEPAGAVWGLPADEAEDALRARLGADFRVAAIGPAGEAGVRFATISHDGRHAGRGGLGAVLGAKNVKAVAVRGKRKVWVHDPARVLALARDLRERSLGRATEKYRELGTLANLLAFNAVSALPVRNFRDSGFAEAPQLAAEELGALRRVARNACAACSIGCEHVYATKGGGSARVEYENVFALGPLVGVGDPDAVLEASALCDRLGLDTISAGGTIAWAMECAERGLIDAPWLRFGDAGALVRALEEIGRREGLGALLAEGSRRAAEVVGGGSEALAPHVKGLELPGYEPRTLHAAALGFAVGSRGADHNRSGAYEADLSGAVDRLDGGAAHAAAAVRTEDRAALMDSLVLCKFLRGVFDDPLPEWSGLLEAVTGWDVTPAELDRTARRIVLLRRLYNLEAGWTRAEDTLPARLLEERVTLPDGTTAGLDAERLERMIAAYYDERGLDADGIPLPATLEAVGLARRGDPVAATAG